MNEQDLQHVKNLIKENWGNVSEIDYQDSGNEI